MKRLLWLGLAVAFLTLSTPVLAADLSITAANVVAGSDAIIEHGTAGATITAGQPVYKKASDSKFYLADTNSATTEVRTAVGIALHASLAGQPLAVEKSGSITIGATLTAGVAYYLSGTAGGIAPVADLTTGDYPEIIGIATSTTVLKLVLKSAGAAL